MSEPTYAITQSGQLYHHHARSGNHRWTLCGHNVDAVVRADSYSMLSVHSTVAAAVEDGLICGLCRRHVRKHER